MYFMGKEDQEDQSRPKLELQSRKYKVEQLYPFHALLISQSGQRECFQYWEIEKRTKKPEKSNIEDL